MNKQQMIDAGRAEGVSDKVIQRRLKAAGFSENLDTAEDAATYEQRHDAIVARYKTRIDELMQAIVDNENETTAAMLKLNQEFGVVGDETTGEPPKLSAIMLENEAQDHRARVIHWPECWDTTAYPTLESAENDGNEFNNGVFKCGNDDCPHKIDNGAGVAIVARVTA